MSIEEQSRGLKRLLQYIAWKIRTTKKTKKEQVLKGGGNERR